MRKSFKHFSVSYQEYQLSPSIQKWTEENYNPFLFSKRLQFNFSYNLRSSYHYLLDLTSMVLG